MGASTRPIVLLVIALASACAAREHTRSGADAGVQADSGSTLSRDSGPTLDLAGSGASTHSARDGGVDLHAVELDCAAALECSHRDTPEALDMCVSRTKRVLEAESDEVLSRFESLVERCQHLHGCEYVDCVSEMTDAGPYV